MAEALWNKKTWETAGLKQLDMGTLMQYTHTSLQEPWSMINETRTIRRWSGMSYKYIGNQGIAICPAPLWPVPHHLNSAKLMADDICCSQLMGLCCQTAKHARNISWIYGGYICLGGFLILCWRSSAVSGCVLNHFNLKTPEIVSIYLSVCLSVYLSIYLIFTYV